MDDIFFKRPGATVLVDGQFGSTGKGLLAGWIAEKWAQDITHYTTNAGPNSGHTAYFKDEKVMTQQIPVAAVFAEKMGYKPRVMLNGGAIVDMDILEAEIKRLGLGGAFRQRLAIHPCAADIGPAARERDIGTVYRISSTGKGTGPALAAKIERSQEAVIGDLTKRWGGPGPMTRAIPPRSWDAPWKWAEDVVFVETAQGFSLGINSARFYPYTTSRECTVSQAIADARIPASMVDKVFMCVRTFPIRVGNAPHSYSGDWYEDQTELTWDILGVEPELTTVTGRVRRVASWSRIQFMEACAVNRPDVVFLNFCNYLNEEGLNKLITLIKEDGERVMGHAPRLLLGFGPKTGDVQWGP